MGEIASAYVQIIPSFKGAQVSITKGLAGVDGTITKKSRGWGNTITSTLGNAFKGVAQAGTVALGATTAAIGAFIPSAISASDATDKFKKTLEFAGLESSQIDALTASARAYADSTVYSLSDIQTITAQLASNGVANYDRLAEAAGNLNAVAGGNADTFKSVGMVLTQTAGMGKLTTENWNQLSEAIAGASGPLQKALSDAGAYTGNFRKAMEEGQISAEEFNAALMQLGFDEVAVEAAKSTETFENAWGNLSASITGGLQDAINTVKPQLVGLINAVTPLVEGLAGKLTGFLSGLDFSQMGGALTSFLPVILGIAGAMGGLASQLPIIGGLFGGLSAPAGIVAGLLGTMLANSEPLRASLGGAFESIGTAVGHLSPVIGGLMATLGTVLGQLGDALAPIITSLAGGLSTVLVGLAPVITMVASQLGALVQAIMPAVSSVLASLAPVITQIASMVGQNLVALTPLVAMLMNQLIPLIQLLAPLVQTVITSILGVLQPAIALVQSIIGTMLAVITGDWQGAWTGIQGIFTNAWATLQALVSGAFEILASIVTTAIKGVVSVVSRLPGLIVGALSALGGMIAGVATNAWDMFTSAVSSGIGAVTSLVSSLPGQIVGVIGNLGNLLVDSGRSLMTGLWNGINEKIGWLKNKVSGVLSSIRNLFPFSPAKEGPFSGHGWVSYSGQSIMQAMGKGMLDALPALTGATEKALQASRSMFDYTPNIPTPVASMAGGQTTVLVQPGAVVIDAQTVTAMRDVEEFFTRLPVLARMNS